MKKEIINIIQKSIDKLEFPTASISLQKPNTEQDCDLATNVAFSLAKIMKKNPMDIAKLIKNEIAHSDIFSEIKVAKPGFINFKLKSEVLVSKLNTILTQNENYGKNQYGKNKTANIEFVSANPTGPLTVGHGRGAILGDIISNIYTWNGYEVDREYYYNNAGRQMRKLAESIYARYLEICSVNSQFPEDGYKGAYIKNIALLIKEKYDKKFLKKFDLETFKNLGEEYIFNDIKNSLKQLGIVFDTFYNENTLYENKKIYEVIEDLDSEGLIYKKDGATWFNGSKVGRDSDRVLIKSTGEPTYRLPDMAYHITKFERKYDIIVDIFGADHMDAYPDVLEVLNQLNYDTNQIKVLIHQFISIVKDGKIVKMSTREANFITLDELIKDVGSDVVRYFFVMRGMNSHLNFDLELAKEKSEKNPVYYIQYAHARISNILLKSNFSDIDLKKVDLLILNNDSEKKIINKLIDFEDIISKLLSTHEPQMLANYLHELASLFHKYYAHHRIIQENVELSNARLVLIKSIQVVLKNGLTILGISKPNKM